MQEQNPLETTNPIDTAPVGPNDTAETSNEPQIGQPDLGEGAAPNGNPNADPTFVASGSNDQLPVAPHNPDQDASNNQGAVPHIVVEQLHVGDEPEAKQQNKGPLEKNELDELFNDDLKSKSPFTRIASYFVKDKPKPKSPSTRIVNNFKSYIAEYTEVFLEGSKGMNLLLELDNLPEKIGSFTAVLSDPQKSKKISQFLKELNNEINKEEKNKQNIDRVLTGLSDLDPLLHALAHLALFVTAKVNSGDLANPNKASIKNISECQLHPILMNLESSITQYQKSLTDHSESNLGTVLLDLSTHLEEYAISLNATIYTAGSLQPNIISPIMEFYREAKTFLEDKGKFTPDNMKEAFKAFKTKLGLTSPIQQEFEAAIFSLSANIQNLEQNFEQRCNDISAKHLIGLKQDSAVAVAKEINAMMNGHKNLLKEAWSYFEQDLLPEAANNNGINDISEHDQQRTDSALTIYFSALNDQIKEVKPEILYKQYLVDDNEIKSLIEAMNQAIIKLELNDPKTIADFDNSMTAVMRKFEGYSKKLKAPTNGDSDEAKEIEASDRPLQLKCLNWYIKEKGLFLASENYDARKIAVLRSAFMRIADLKKNGHGPQIARTILEKNNIGYETIQNSHTEIKNWIPGFAARLTSQFSDLEGFLSPENIKATAAATSAFHNNEIKITNLKFLKDKLAKASLLEKFKGLFINKPKVDASLTNEVDRVFPTCIDFLANNHHLKLGLGLIVDADNFQEKISPPKGRTFAELKTIAQGNVLDKKGKKIPNQPVMAQRDREEQAHFAKQISEVKYNLSEEEVILLQQAIGTKFNKGKIGLKETKDTMTFDSAIKIIELKERFLNMENRGTWWRVGPFKHRTKHLDAAKQYLEFYKNKAELSQKPEVRLMANKHRSVEYKAGKEFRKSFYRTTNSLSSLFTTNKAIKKLQKALFKKHRDANELKKHIPLITENKFNRNKTTNDNLKQKVGYTQAGVPVRFPAQFFQSKIDHSVKEVQTEFNDIFTPYPEISQLGELLDTFHNTLDMKLKVQKIKKRFEDHAKPKRLDYIPMPEEEIAPYKQAMIDECWSGNRDHLTELEIIEVDKNNYSSRYAEIVIAEEAYSEVNELITNELDQMLLQDRKKTLEALYQKTIQSAQRLDENSKIFPPDQQEQPGFNIHDPKALQSIASIVTNVKAAKKEVVRNGNLFSKFLTASINGLSKTIGILISISNELNGDPANFSRLIDNALKMLNGSRLTIRSKEDIETMSHTFFIDFEINIIRGELEKIEKIITDDPENSIAVLEKTLESLQAECGSLNKNASYRQARIKNVIDAAVETSKAITYLADHTTSSLGGKRDLVYKV